MIYTDALHWAHVGGMQCSASKLYLGRLRFPDHPPLAVACSLARPTRIDRRGDQRRSVHIANTVSFFGQLAGRRRDACWQL
jgi:hypothetical protein